jgi:hypothetical protein
MGKGRDVQGGPPEGTFVSRVAKDGRVLIEWQGRLVTVVAGAEGSRLAARLACADAAGRQALLARATRNFKRGNERAIKKRR